MSHQQTGCRPLYITSQGAKCSLKNQAVIVEIDGRSERFLLKDIDQIVVKGRVVVSSPLLQECLSRGIPVVFLTSGGDLLGRLDQGMGRQDLIVAQVARDQDPEFRLAMARNLVQGKITAQMDFLLSRRSPPPELERLTAKLGGLRKVVPKIVEIAKLIGVEGIAAKTFFEALALLLKSDLPFEGRTRRPPRDPINALLSLGYTLLFADVHAVLLACGLDTRFAFLHQAHRERPALAIDLMEEFRTPVVDRMIMRLVNQKVFTSKHFVASPKGGFYLVPEARKRFIREYEGAIAESRSVVGIDKITNVRALIEKQGRQLRKSIVEGDVHYHPCRFIYK